MEKTFIYLDDIRTPKQNNWVVVRSYEEFIAKVSHIGLENIAVISLDHDLGDTAMAEYHSNVSPNYKLDYNNIREKTGYDCAKWLVSHFYNQFPSWSNMDRPDKQDPEAIFLFPKVFTHSANPIGSANIMGYINNFLMNEDRPQTCVRVLIDHTV